MRKNFFVSIRDINWKTKWGNVKNELKINEKIKNNVINGDDYRNIEKLKLFLLKNKNNIFLSNTKSFLIPFSYILIIGFDF